MLPRTIALFAAFTLLAGCQAPPARQARIPNDRVIERDLRPPTPVIVQSATPQSVGDGSDVVKPQLLANEVEKKSGPRARRSSRKLSRNTKASL